MRVIDLADAVAPGVPREVTGIRPGEKLHEVLITSDESRHAVKTGSVFVIIPEHPWWSDDLGIEGEPVDDGWVYASDTNEEWLAPNDLASMIR